MSFTVHQAFNLEKDLLTNNFHIAVIQPHKIPPHIAVIHQKKYFDITYNNSRCGLDADAILTNLKEKKMLLFELNLKIPYQTTLKHFSAYSKIPEGKTCLLPVKEIFSDCGLDLYTSQNFIFELIPLLNENNHIEKIYSLNMLLPFTLISYSYQDIENRINFLRSKNLMQNA
jgi:hypothetical protein